MAPRLRLTNLTLDQLRRAARGELVPEADDEQGLLQVFANEVAAGVYALERGYTAFQVQEIERLTVALRSDPTRQAFVRRYLGTAQRMLGLADPADVLKYRLTMGFWMMVLHQHFSLVPNQKHVAA